MGVFRMADLVGGDVVSFVNQNFKSSYGDRTFESPVRKAMVEDKLLGEKTKKGFYDHSSGKPEEWSGLEAYLNKARAQMQLPQVLVLLVGNFYIMKEVL